MIRQHQFDKVELVQIVRPEESYRTLEEFTGHAERVLQRLGSAYRVVVLCAGESASAAPRPTTSKSGCRVRARYREISSCSNCEAFRARACWRAGAIPRPASRNWCTR